MDINIQKSITGVKEETYTGLYSVRAAVVVKYLMEDGQDLRDVSPDTANEMVDETLRRLREMIENQVSKEIINVFLEKEKDGVLITSLVKGSLRLVNPETFAKEQKLRDKVKPKSEVKRTERKSR